MGVGDPRLAAMESQYRAAPGDVAIPPPGYPRQLRLFLHARFATPSKEEAEVRAKVLRISS